MIFRPLCWEETWACPQMKGDILQSGKFPTLKSVQAENRQSFSISAWEKGVLHLVEIPPTAKILNTSWFQHLLVQVDQSDTISCVYPGVCSLLCCSKNVPFASSWLPLPHCLPTWRWSRLRDRRCPTHLCRSTTCLPVMKSTGPRWILGWRGVELGDRKRNMLAPGSTANPDAAAR